MPHDPLLDLSRRKPPHLRPYLLGGAAIAVLAAVAGFSVRAYDYHRLVRWTDAQAIPTVQMIQVHAPTGGHDMTLPGRLEAWVSAPIHARVDGYLKSWTADIGSEVHAGEVLGTIDTPSLDQQYAQAKADLVRAKASASLARITSQRWKNLLSSDSVSRQETDEKSGQAAVAMANVNAAQAEVDRLAAMESFKNIVAPFNGTVTARNTDIGDLIVANSNNSAALFTVADTHRMRLYVSVPQGYSSAIKPGMKVTLDVPGHAGETFTATLIGNSDAVSQSSGTVLAQFEIDNADGALMPGDFAEVHIPMAVDRRATDIPATALLFRAAGPQVALLGEHGHVVLRSVHIGMDHGNTLEIDQGLEPGDRIINHPPDSLAQGDQVRLADSLTEESGDDAHKAG